jgi:protein-tyrosine phosphatase
MNFYQRFLKSRHPFEYSQITDQLYVAAWPVGENFAEIVDLGVRLVINMDWVPADPKLSQAPLHLLALETRDSPLTPMPMEKIWTGVRAAAETMAAGDKVMVYCKGGVHRSVVMACCILISQGLSADEAMRLVKEKRPVAKPETPQKSDPGF